MEKLTTQLLAPELQLPELEPINDLFSTFTHPILNLLVNLNPHSLPLVQAVQHRIVEMQQNQPNLTPGLNTFIFVLGGAIIGGIGGLIVEEFKNYLSKKSGNYQPSDLTKAENRKSTVIKGSIGGALSGLFLNIYYNFK